MRLKRKDVIWKWHTSHRDKAQMTERREFLVDGNAEADPHGDMESGLGFGGLRGSSCDGCGKWLHK